MKILVIGDSCIDVFKYGKCDRICPEAPVPVFIPNGKTTSNLGMAYNVYRNLLELNSKESYEIITNSDDERPTKTRYIDDTSNQMLLRIDENDNVERISFEKLSSIKYYIYDAVIISDYNKGFLDESDIEFISNECMRNQVLTFLDTKKKMNGWISNIDVIKINEKEFEQNKNALTVYYKNTFVVTMGGSGAFYGSNGFIKPNYFIPIKTSVDIRDLSGAGDTFLAALVYTYLKENENNENTKDDVIKKSIEFANTCASWVVTQRGVVPVNFNKI